MVTDEEVELIVDGKLSWGCLNHFGRDNYTMVSTDSGRGFKGYPAVRFGNSYNKSIRVHWLIVLMDVGIQAVELCVGEFRTHEIHHIIPIGSGGTNSIENLVIMRKSDHEELHGHYRGNRGE
ncbi:HNH endonuclease signature motif containing protein [Cohnella yongneupensis]|uniref:HNH endonuclease signature motif containing protein n=1 Tax=Cohnella yongneupensis TaxID=425006 RepID=A0ABW0QWA0_9BACL